MAFGVRVSQPAQQRDFLVKRIWTNKVWSAETRESAEEFAALHRQLSPEAEVTVEELV